MLQTCFYILYLLFYIYPKDKIYLKDNRSGSTKCPPPSLTMPLIICGIDLRLNAVVKLTLPCLFFILFFNSHGYPSPVHASTIGHQPSRPKSGAGPYRSGTGFGSERCCQPRCYSGGGSSGDGHSRCCPNRGRQPGPNSCHPGTQPGTQPGCYSHRLTDYRYPNRSQR